jgi:hypothetical protein
MEKVLSIYENPNYFTTYSKNASEKIILAELFCARCELLHEPKTLLDVGTYDGALLARLFKYGSKLDSMEKVTGIDPVENEQAFLSHMAPFEWDAAFIQSDLASYLDKSVQHFDVIIASQCLYWSEYLAKELVAIVNRSQAACIVIRGKKGIYQIQQKFSHLLGNAKEKLYHSEHVDEILRASHIHYDKNVIPSHIHIPPYQSQAWQEMASFFIQNEFQALAKAEKAALNDYLLSLVHDDKIEHEVHVYWTGAFAQGGS